MSLLHAAGSLLSGLYVPKQLCKGKGNGKAFYSKHCYMPDCLSRRVHMQGMPVGACQMAAHDIILCCNSLTW